MNVTAKPGALVQRAGIEQIPDFDEIIDVRTPLEFAEDHIPGAINAPVLSNEERVRVGTLYARSPFEATRVGAALVARNIANHLETLFQDRPKSWRPLVYCWRGGKRSGSLAAWMNLVGWQAQALEGGYKTYRNHVLDTLETRPAELQFQVLVGPTGTGKTRLLHALLANGAQVLDLEGLAAHRGSLLGQLPQQPQPTQKMFESLLWQALGTLDAGRPVVVEAESPRIGRLVLPKSLLQSMYRGRCVRITATLDDRIDFLLEDYQHLFDDAHAFCSLLDRFMKLHSRSTVQEWQQMVLEGRRRDVFRELMRQHYDPRYTRSSGNHFHHLDKALEFAFRPNATDTAEQAAGLLAKLR